MNTDIQEATFEIVPQDIQLAPEARHTLEEAFSSFFVKAQQLKDQADGVTSPKLARVARLEIKGLRVAAEKKRKELKEDSLRMGKAIDGANHILLALLVPIEKRLEDIEKEEERRIAAEIESRRVERRAMLEPYGVVMFMDSPTLGTMPQEDFDALYADSKAMHEARIERERKAEEERLAREVEEAKERERIRLENERLLNEAKEREEAARIEREKADAERKALEEKLAKERKEAEVKAAAEAERVRLEKEEAARAASEVLMKAQAAAEAQRREAEEKANRERAAAEEVARKEHLRLQALAEVERQKAQAAQEAAARLEAEARAKLEKEAEQKRLAEEASEKASLAPDKEKLIALSEYLRNFTPPAMRSKKGASALEQIKTKIANLADWIEEKSQGL